MDTRRKDCATGHLERKKTGYWYMVFRTKDEFRTINTQTAHPQGVVPIRSGLV